MTLTSVDDWTIIFDIPIWLWKSFTIIDTLCIWSPGIVDFNILFVTDLVLFYVWSVFFAWTVYHLRCLCPWIVRLNTLEYRPSGYVIGLLKFCVSASFWQFRDIKLSFCVLSIYLCSLYTYVFSHVRIYSYLLIKFYSTISVLFWRTISSFPIALCTFTINYLLTYLLTGRQFISITKTLN